MWSYSAPDRTPQPATAPPHDEHEKVARRHQQPIGYASKLRLVPHQDNDGLASNKENLP